MQTRSEEEPRRLILDMKCGNTRLVDMRPGHLSVSTGRSLTNPIRKEEKDA